MMTAEKQILEGTAAIKTLESIYADEKLSAEIRKINADACSGMAQAAYYYAAGKTQLIIIGYRFRMIKPIKFTYLFEYHLFYHSQ